MRERGQDIGHALASDAAKAHTWQPMPVSGKDVSRARRAWFQSNWPEHYQRMEGAARFAGVDLEADEYHLDGRTGIPQGAPLPQDNAESMRATPVPPLCRRRRRRAA